MRGTPDLEEKSGLLEIAFEKGAEAQAFHRGWRRVLVDSGCQKLYGPEPSGPAERAVQERIKEIEGMLNIKNKGRVKQTLP